MLNKFSQKVHIIAIIHFNIEEFCKNLFFRTEFKLFLIKNVTMVIILSEQKFHNTVKYKNSIRDTISLRSFILLQYILLQ